MWAAPTFNCALCGGACSAPAHYPYAADAHALWGPGSAYQQRAARAAGPFGPGWAAAPGIDLPPLRRGMRWQAGKLAAAARLLLQGATIRAAGAATGMAKPTLHRLRAYLGATGYAVPPCPCGRPGTHRAGCGHRLRATPAGRAALAGRARQGRVWYPGGAPGCSGAAHALELARWGAGPVACPACAGTRVYPTRGYGGRAPRWACSGCHRTFTAVTRGPHHGSMCSPAQIVTLYHAATTGAGYRRAAAAAGMSLHGARTALRRVRAALAAGSPFARRLAALVASNTPP